MALFEFLKKKEQVPTCDLSHITSIKVLGAGCRNCKMLLESVKTACRHLDLCVKVEYITDMDTIMDYGAMRMPALVVNERVVSAGRVLTAAEAEKILRG